MPGGEDRPMTHGDPTGDDGPLEVVVLHGSPRPEGDSTRLAEEFLGGVRSAAPARVRHFRANEMHIQPCQGCLSCRTAPGHRCVLRDDMDAIYDVFAAADVVVFATPMYWGYMTAQLKTVMDRMESLAWEHFAGKTFVVLITYHHHCASTVAFFERICPFFGVDLHVVTCRTLDDQSRQELPISSCTEELARARRVGEAIGAGRGTAGAH